MADTECNHQPLDLEDSLDEPKCREQSTVLTVSSYPRLLLRLLHQLIPSFIQTLWHNQAENERKERVIRKTSFLDGLRGYVI
jgi:hypothetical protein